MVGGESVGDGEEVREWAGESSSEATRDGELSVDMIAMSAKGAEAEGQSRRMRVEVDSERGMFERRKDIRLESKTIRDQEDHGLGDGPLREERARRRGQVGKETYLVLDALYVRRGAMLQ